MALPLEDSPDDRTLIRYLLGATSEDETERLDELSVTDDELTSRLDAVEDDLVDAYVNGELHGEQLDRFRSHYLASPANRAKVEFAETLHAYSRAHATDVGVASASRRTTVGLESRRPWRATASVAAKWMPAAAALVIVAAGYLLIENRRLRREVADVRAAHADLADQERQLQNQLNEQRSASADAARDLARLRESLAGRGAAGQADNAGVLAFLLLPATRAAGGVTTIAIPRRTTAVTLRVQLEADDFPRYRAMLKDAATERTLWRSARLQPASLPGQPSVVTLAVGVLEPRLYTLEITGVPARGDEEVVGSYPFRVVLQ